MLINWLILLYGCICGGVGIVFGVLIYKEVHAKEVAHLNNKIRFYESHNHYVFQDTSESIPEADANERW